MASITNITNSNSFEHKGLCVKAGIIAGTLYATQFCDYLLGTGTSDWYTLSGGIITWNASALEEYKKEWIKLRAGAQNKQEQEDSKLAEQEAATVDKATADAVKSANTTQEKIDAQNNRKDMLKQQIRKLESEIKDLTKSQKQTGISNEAQIKELQTKIAGYTKSIEDCDNIINNELKPQLEKDKATAKEAEREAKENAKGNKWWFKKLKEYKTKELKAEAEKNKKKAKNILQLYSTEDLITLSVYANTNNNGENGTHTWKTYDADESGEKQLTNQLNEVLGSIWKKFPTITSIRKEMDPEIINNANAITPDASAAMLKGAISNTFEAAILGKELLSSPELVQRRIELLEAATATATDRFIKRVTACMTASTLQIIDLTPITQIPADAVQQMVNYILTPAQVMQIIADMLNDGANEQKNEQSLNGQIAELEGLLSENMQQINFLYGDKLSAFNTAMADIKTIINQGPDWYIDNINKLEYQYEKETIKQIEDKTADILDAKYQFRDNAVDTIAQTLVIPVNDALLKTQLAIIRALVQAIKRAEQIALAMAEKAIMALLGLLGA